jgi:hypothetical protein
VRLSGYKEEDFATQVLRNICRNLEIDTKHFRIINRVYLLRPRPIYTSTAQQIGLLTNENVPNLVPFLLPKTYNSQSARFLKKWVLNPPPYEIANEMQSLCRLLLTNKVPLPIFHPVSIGFFFCFLFFVAFSIINKYIFF